MLGGATAAAPVSVTAADAAAALVVALVADTCLFNVAAAAAAAPEAEAPGTEKEVLPAAPIKAAGMARSVGGEAAPRGGVGGSPIEVMSALPPGVLGTATLPARARGAANSRFLRKRALLMILTANKAAGSAGAAAEGGPVAMASRRHSFTVP